VPCRSGLEALVWLTVVYGGDDRYRLKPEVEAISLLDLQREPLGW
jgi:hypothetical protein